MKYALPVLLAAAIAAAAPALADNDHGRGGGWRGGGEGWRGGDRGGESRGNGGEHEPREPEVQELSLIHISEPTRLRRISYAVFCGL